MKQLYLFILLILSSFLSYSQSDCGDAVTASEGLNSFNTIGYDSYWFTYELSAGKKVTISSTDFVNFDISSGPDCDNRTNIVYDYQNVTISNLEDGATLYIRLSRFNTETFEFRLVSSDLISGDNCNLATSANEGVNSFDADAYVPRWFRFELPEDKKLTLNSSSYGEVAMFSGSDCEYPSNYTSGDTNLSFTRLSTGGTVFIKINPYNTEVFEFELTVSDFETGDNCELADQAVDGVNSFPVTTNSIYWYKYTMVKSGNLNMDFTGYRPVNVYKGSNCAGKFFISGASFPRTLTGLNAGDDLYFQWTNNGDFDFTLTEADPIPGESCETAEIAVLGTNSIPSTNVDYFWYTYRMPTDLNQKIIIEAGNDRDITVYSGNCESFSTLGSSDGALKVLGLASDEDIYIRIDTNGSGDFDWNLGVESEGVGDSCDDPEVATTGSNFTPVSPYWFSYTTPIAGTYTISSVGLATEDTYLRVYSDCQGTLIGENDDFSGLQSEVELELSEEQTIYILWDDTYNAEGFSWNISSDAIPDEKEDQTITFNSLDSRTFGDADFELTAETSSGLAVSYTSSNTVVATVSGSTVSILEPGSTIITASQTGNVAYNAADPVERTLTIKKANQTISLDAISDKLVTDADFTIPATATSGLTLSYSVSGPAIVSGNTLSLTGETGSVSITASQEGDANYNAAASVSTEFLVTDPAKTNQTITFAELEARTYGVLGINLNGTSSSGLSLTYESSNPSVATIDGNLIVVNTAGTTTITASQEGDATYNPAEPVSRELVINKADQTITVSAIGDKEVTDEPFDVEASVSSGLQLSYAVEGPATISGNTLTLSEEAGTVTVNVSQAGNVNYNPVSESVSFEVSNPRSDQTISITEISNKFTTDAPFEVEASTTSELALTYEVIGPATIDGTTVTLDGTVGTVEVTASQAGNDNYNPASETISFEVTEDLCLDFSATATTSAVSCAGSTDGTLTVETTEGTAPFSYSLAGADAVENNEFTELEAGEYTVEVTDANGCSTTVTASITSPDALEITAEVENSNSINGNGSISLTVTGGTGEYTYSWSNEATTSSLEALEVGEYTVTVTDESGCTIEESFTIGGVTANEEALAGSLLIFPNPAKNVVQLQHSEKAKSLKLYDARGKLINEIATEGETTELEVSQLPSGLYFIRQEGASQLYRFVKE